MPIIADRVPSAPTCHVFSFPPQNHPDGNVLIACVKSSDNRMMEIISSFCLANNTPSAALEGKKMYKLSQFEVF